MSRSEPPFQLLWCLGLVVLLPGAVPAGPGVPTGHLGQEDWTTPYYIRTGPQPGPTVLVVSGLHGDEPAGPLAAEQIRSWPLRRGTLILLPRANPPALRAHKRLTPGESAEAGNLNRAFPPRPNPDSPTARFAAALWDFVRRHPPDWLLDLHEGSDFRIQTNRSVGNSIIVSAQPETRRMGEVLQTNLNATIPDPHRHFVLLRLGMASTLARAAADHLGIRAMIVETTLRSQPLALRTHQHRLAVHTLLRALEMLPEDVPPERMVDAAEAAGFLKVAVYDGAGATGRGIPSVLAHLGQQTHVRAWRVAPEDIRAGGLAQFDVVCFTGGSGSGQGQALGEAGRVEVRRFVERGGGYLGICAGAYLACNGFSWGLGILDAQTRSPKWQRGEGTVQLELTEAGRAVLGGAAGRFDCHYQNGPVVGPAERPEVPDYETLAFFRTELAENDTPPGLMVNSPAILSGRFGQGRVVCFSPHPEQTPGLEGFVVRAAEWAAGRAPPAAAAQ